MASWCGCSLASWLRRERPTGRRTPHGRRRQSHTRRRAQLRAQLHSSFPSRRLGQAAGAKPRLLRGADALPPLRNFNKVNEEDGCRAVTVIELGSFFRS